MTNDLSEFIPWILAIFFVLFLIACCSWLYRCIQKCDDQCPGILPARSPYNPNSPMTPFRNTRHTRNWEATRRLTCQRATNDNSEPSGSQCILSSSSVVHYHGQKVPPYVSFADRPPPPSYEEACSSTAALSSSTTALNMESPEQSVAIIDTTSANETEATPAATVSDSVEVMDCNTAAVSTPTNTGRGDRPQDHGASESVVIDNPQDEPLINDDDDDDDEFYDVVIDATPHVQATSEEMTRRGSTDVFL
ncbi:uncharacterized protein LOC110980565 isoform X1 [Acanthaster planci]|uniref:Uncharacterized protein LOC110980565 isoform X1 n=1 Tax=Acanthaster planci TaxID=133434 RepID=A0A8B7YIL2_ACAPL|nr:uncharacterized protein LOC110980565 isoform X1 [Acanthaster planci]